MLGTVLNEQKRIVLLEVRSKLILEKKSSNTISVRGLQEMVGRARLKIPDPEVSSVLDEVFGEYLGVNKASTSKQVINNHAKETSESDDNRQQYSESNVLGGSSKVKAMPYFKGSTDHGQGDKVA